MTTTFAVSIAEHRASLLARASRILEDVVALDATVSAWLCFSPEQVSQALDELPGAIREPYRMHVLDRADDATIAARIGIPMELVSTRLVRARRELRARLLGDTMP